MSTYAVDAAAAASERFTLDVYAGSALVGRSRYYEFLSPTDGGGQSASRVNVRHSSPVVALAIGGTYRLRPIIGVGLEGFGAYELREATHPWSRQIGFSFDRAYSAAVTAFAELTANALDYAPRRGLLLRGGAGIHWRHDGLVLAPGVLVPPRTTGSFAGGQVIGAIGYRWFVAGRASMTLHLRAEMRPSGVLIGLFVGGGVN